jgi:YbgC/YbaW family acyl-CoA thioester hydrolase
MIEVPFKNYLHKVFIKNERVSFSSCDPYGHMNTSEYARMMTDHRAFILDDIAKTPMFLLIEKYNVAYVVKEIDIKFISACKYGDYLEIASWMSAMSEFTCDVYVTIIDQNTKKPKALGKMFYCCADVKTGRPKLNPENFPCLCEEDPTPQLLNSSAYLESVQINKNSISKFFTEKAL